MIVVIPAPVISLGIANELYVIILSFVINSLYRCQYDVSMLSRERVIQVDDHKKFYYSLSGSSSSFAHTLTTSFHASTKLSCVPKHHAIKVYNDCTVCSPSM